MNPDPVPGNPPPPPPPGNVRRRNDPPPNEDSSLYDRCFDGYKCRDQLVPQEFFWVSQLFGLFLGGVVAVVGFLASFKWPAFFLVLFIGVVGFVMIWAFLCDMRANFRCKAALRWVMREIEDGLIRDDVCGDYYWRIIRNRDWIVRERNEIARQQNEPAPAVTDWFIRATWGYLVIWVILIGIVLVGLWIR